MFEANVAIITLPWCLLIISLRVPSTALSLLEYPLVKAFVESLRSRVTPSEPIFAILWISAIGPTGVKSNLKSPVSKIVPFGVLITIAKLSGIEWVVLINDISKYFVLTLKSGVIIW